MKKSAFLFVSLLTAFGATPAAFANRTGPYPLPKSVCNRTHQDVIQSLSANVTHFVLDGEYRMNPVGFDKYNTAPFSKRTPLLETGQYSVIASSYDRLIPRFQMGMQNTGGGLGTGLCWWHSRFHRAAAYLVDFDPRAKKPTSSQAVNIFRKITNFLPVVVPGFDSLYEFTRSFQPELEAVLTEWELRTTALAPKHALRPTFSAFFSSDEEMKNSSLKTLRKTLNELRTRPRPIFMMLDMADEMGLHAFLIVGYRRDTNGDVYLKFLDSNSTGGIHEWKIYADRELDLRYPQFEGIYSFEALRTDFDTDFQRIEAGLRKQCGANHLLR